ncbi:uncharacterized protein LOC134530187 isoform X3 [Bacillus rossius redtenbacheri]|uniref:uncharacterized protein LOC134530187 isoform X3 n=1 Tax=Bacillus rossius redtenbacheri TaxID=93214 RepID=UPI002FDD481A
MDPRANLLFSLHRPREGRMAGPSAEVARRSQRPYRYGMILLCVGALINWLGLAENYVEPVRYVGVACIVAGAMLICMAMCCWLQRPASLHYAAHQSALATDHIHVIEVPCPSADGAAQPKPPDYDSVADTPPCYEEAIKLSPGQLLADSRGASPPPAVPSTPPARRPQHAPATLQPCQMSPRSPAVASCVWPTLLPLSCTSRWERDKFVPLFAPH